MLLLRDRRTLFLLLLVVASLFVVMAVQVRQGGPSETEGPLMRVASPVLRAFSTVTGGITSVWDGYVNLRGTRRRNAELEERVTHLMMQLQELQEASIQNERLRSLLDLREGMGTPSVAAGVIGNNSLGMSRTILVNRGSADGLAANMPVVSGQGVVGRVWTVGPGVSKIQLLTDVEAGTGVLVQRTRVQGILLGQGSDRCALEYVSRLEDVAAGDLLVTSGLDGIYPKGLPVGTVASIGDDQGILKRIVVEPRVEFRKLEEVLILLSREIRLPPQPTPAEPEPPGPAPSQGVAP